MTEDVAEPTIEQRLDAAEEKIAAVKTGLSETNKALFVVLGIALVGVILYAAFWHTSPPAPSNRDTSVEQLLHPGPHCYSSPEERDAARQRALAAIDRIKWDNNHPAPTEPTYSMVPPNVPLPVKAPSVTDTPAGGSWDGSRCFDVVESSMF